MITVIATIRAKPGKGPDLEADFRAWAEVVKAKEPGTLMYSLSRSREDPDVFVAFELYADDAAMSGPAGRAWKLAMWTCTAASSA